MADNMEAMLKEMQAAAAKKDLTPEQHAAIAKDKELLAKPLVEDELNGLVDLKYYGHSGFKISFKDEEAKTRCVYINICVDNPDCPPEERKNPPNDADLALCSHGQLQHSMHTPFLIQVGKKEGRQIICTSEVGMYFQQFRQIPHNMFGKMQPGGTKDYKFAKITMTSASQKSTCPGPDGIFLPGGNAVGFVVSIPNHNFKIYHMGDTAIFSDMKIIDDLYQPDVVIIPVGE